MKHDVKANGIPLPVTTRTRASAMGSQGVHGALSTLRALCVLGLLGCMPSARADTMNTESLGVVNGSITARSQMIEIKPFLSGRALYQYDVQDTQSPVSTLVIEQAQTVSGASRRDGVVWIQQPLSLTGPTAAGLRGFFQLPLQVEVAGKAVEVSVSEDSRGVIVTLPQPSCQVRVRPAGAINFVLPVTYRGEVQADIRIMGNTTAAETSSE
ncbi:MAG: DUF5462 family protein [Hafnia sp.]